MLDDHLFWQRISTHFDPYVSTSGTEHIALLLHSLVRMTRPRTIVEFGPGYTTLFLLKALAENVQQINVEKDALITKTVDSDILGELPAGTIAKSWTDEQKASYRQWLYKDGRACTAAPSFYTTVYSPRVFSFEQLGKLDPYCIRLRGAVEELGFANLFEPHYEGRVTLDVIPADALPIGIAWNDCDHYREFFNEFWNSLDPHGGLMVFHNVTAWSAYYEDIKWMKEQRSPFNDLEILVLEESHKVNQNGCAILRRASHPPMFRAENATQLINDLRDLISPIEAKSSTQ